MIHNIMIRNKDNCMVLSSVKIKEIHHALFDGRIKVNHISRFNRHNLLFCNLIAV